MIPINFRDGSHSSKLGRGGGRVYRNTSSPGSALAVLLSLTYLGPARVPMFSWTAPVAFSSLRNRCWEGRGELLHFVLKRIRSLLLYTVSGSKGVTNLVLHGESSALITQRQRGCQMVPWRQCSWGHTSDLVPLCTRGIAIWWQQGHHPGERDSHHGCSIGNINLSSTYNACWHILLETHDSPVSATGQVLWFPFWNWDGGTVEWMNEWVHAASKSCHSVCFRNHIQRKV